MPGNFHSIPESILKTWPKPNYVDPVTRGWLPAFSCTLLAFSTILIGGRFYQRARRQAGEFGLDDLFIFIGWLFSIAVTALAVMDGILWGIDKHTWDVKPEQYMGAALNGWIAQVVFITSTGATKASVLLFYRRMTKDTYSRLWLYAIWFALAFTAAYWLGVLLTYCFICTPLDAYWLSYNFSYHKPYTCLDGNILSPLVGSLSIVSDIYAVVLPCTVLHYYDLKVPRAQKVGLNIIFALGLIVAGCGGARTYYLWKINHTYDTSWTGFDLYVWSLLECHLAVIFACAPALRAFLRRYLGETFRTTFRSRTGTNNKSITEEFASQGNSTVRNSQMLSDPELGKEKVTIDQTILAKASEETMTSHNEDVESARSQSSETVPTIKNADDYEAYQMRQLSRYGFKRSDTVKSEKTADMSNPRTRHDVDNARSWLDDEWLQ